MLPLITQPAVAPACYKPRLVVGQSLLFRRSGSTHLNRVAVAPTDSKRATIVLAHQRTILSTADMALFGTGTAGITFSLYFNGADQLRGDIAFSSGTISFVTSRLFRDGAHCLIVLGIDTTQALASDRYWLEVNGEAVSFASATYPAQNATLTYLNAAGITQRIGAAGSSIASTILDGPVAEVYVLDGTALHSSRFVDINIHGVPVLKAPTLSLAEYGVNGCHLDFALPLSPGTDVSGKGNHWTASGFDLAGTDTVANSPTNVYPVLSPVDKSTSITLKDGNRTATASNNYIVRGTMPIPSEGSWCWETIFNSVAGGTSCGITLASNTVLSSAGLDVAGTVRCYGPIRRDGAVIQTPGTLANGDVVGTVCDMTTRTVQYYKNGVAHGVPVSLAVGIYLPMFDPANSGGVTVNFGAHPFAHAYGTAKPLCTNNLPEPGIKDPAEAYADEVGTGANIIALLDASTAHWNGAAYVEIIKRRDTAESWRWRFSDDPGQAIASDNANAKVAAPALAAGGAYVGYRLRVGKQFGVWTAEVVHVTGTATTVTHGLATTRNVVIAKRVSVGGGDWPLRHPDMAAGNLLWLNKVVAAASDGTITAFGADSFQIGAAAPSGTYRVLVMAERPGALALAKHTGNGQADGAFCPLDLSPEWLLIGKATVGGGWAWQVRDGVRAKANPDTAELRANTPDVEASASPEIIDKVVGGYKTRSANGSTNEASCTYYTVAIGRPIGGVCVAPATAR
ncbi:MAG: hypothetical protein K2X44_00400 [Magnetospirillum sp.]|nr:hypothetical protein [Magnetospirillum sp.]